ncbi:sulfotransferase [Roseovarius sp. MBR-51]
MPVECAQTSDEHPLIVFIHIPKTAGSMVNHHLTTAGLKGQDHVESCIDHPDDLSLMANSLDWVSGHVSKPAMHLALERVTQRPKRYFSAVREPIRQIASHYNWLIEIQHRGEVFFENHPEHIKAISHAINRTQNSDPKAVIKRLQEFSGLFLNQQSKILARADVWLDEKDGLDQALDEYEFIAHEGNLDKLLMYMTGKDILALDKINNSTSHFDRKVFATPEMQEFLAEYHSNDLALYQRIRDRGERIGAEPPKAAKPLSRSVALEWQSTDSRAQSDSSQDRKSSRHKAAGELRTPDFIIAGYERGGTTLLSELFRANGYESGLECGVLMAHAPAEFPQIQPYWNNMPKDWNLSAETFYDAISGDVATFYDRIFSAAFPDHSGGYFDKTPKYMDLLGLCLHRAPFARGAVVIHRDPRAVFASMSKRIEPTLDAVQTIEKHFDFFVSRYLSYFCGCIAHLERPNVLFVPFEELVSREQTWLKVLGHFARGTPFQPMSARSRFDNVTSETMDLEKVIEFDRLLPQALQTRILEATQLASLFFAGPVERARYGQLWQDRIGLAKQRLGQFDLPATGVEVDGAYFEPLTYLLRYVDVLKSGLNPVDHYIRHGRGEKRRPA